MKITEKRLREIVKAVIKEEKLQIIDYRKAPEQEALL